MCQVATQTFKESVLLSSIDTWDYADVKERKTNTKPQACCFIRFMLMITEINKIDETPNLKETAIFRVPFLRCFIVL